MKLVLFALVFLSFLVISSLYISKEDKSLDKELKSIKHPDTKPLEELHKKFSEIKINSDELDLNQTIEAIKQARQAYPLDDKLKTIEIELEHKKANEPTKY
ncbi:hypothetical protein SMGD1_0571 [Sulfurimonas gotlandica GD1]|uniref:Uncharacterized protein n=1 Tax=Sulfurimonas gotlandica (strain DSM 19862 / JCM 16533 / GD1) TaxID=929558 RepID=H1FVQ0_SULGG|nr:hypothetical protein [Sulfurimonas gotlandica]EHP29098.1 hypothetical protein SMGD1_0571 [Sulfurimonas gotlandica GD1]